MPQKQTYRAHTLKAVQRDGASSRIPETILLDKEDQVVDESQSYAMIHGLLQVLVRLQSLAITQETSF